MEQLIFDHLDKYVSAPLSDVPVKDKWQKISYSADGKEGVMLFASELSRPEAIELDLKVEGVYRIYICLGYVAGASAVEISLSDGSGKTCLNPSFLEWVNGYARWQACEYAEEGYFKTADLTDKKIIFNKPYKSDAGEFGARFSSCILYIRLEKPTEKELEEFYAPTNKKTVAYHFDGDYFAECEYKSVEDYLGRLDMLTGGNGETLVHEVDNLSFYFSPGENDFYTAYSKHRECAMRPFFKHKDEIIKAIYDKAKTMGMNVLGGIRMNLCDFNIPNNTIYGFNGKYPDLRAVLRNGKQADFYSYAYPETRKLMIDHILESLPTYFDGVSLFFCRGGFVLFDKPVIDDVKRLYGVDARRLPFADERLNSVICSYLTQFMRELKRALDERAEKENRNKYHINVVVLFDLVSSKNFGYDVKTWAKEGLIDSVSQGLMTYYEDLDGVMAKDGLIDLRKYIEKEKKYVLVKRYYGDEEKYVIGPIDGFLKIKEKYGTEFYATLPWESRPYEYYLTIAKKHYEKGVTKFILWNANHTARRLPAINACKLAGDKEKLEKADVSALRKTLKINSLNGFTKVEFDANWKG